MRRVLGLLLVIFAALMFVFGGITGRLPSMLAALTTPESLG